jgi:hypothetical protein
MILGVLIFLRSPDLLRYSFAKGFGVHSKATAIEERAEALFCLARVANSRYEGTLA